MLVFIPEDFSLHCAKDVMFDDGEQTRVTFSSTKNFIRAPGTETNRKKNRWYDPPLYSCLNWQFWEKKKRKK